MFEDAIAAESLLAGTRAAGECQHDTPLHTRDGLRWQRLQLRTARHPHSGAPLIVVGLTPIDDLVRAAAPVHLSLRS